MSSVQSPTASQFARKTLTKEAVKLAALINEAIRIDPVFTSVKLEGLELPQQREETRKDGRPLFYYPDVVIRDLISGVGLALEAMGRGSKSDDPERHQWLIDHGLIPLYFENSDINHSPVLVMRRLRMTIRVLRALLG